MLKPKCETKGGNEPKRGSEPKGGTTKAWIITPAEMEKVVKCIVARCEDMSPCILVFVTGDDVPAGCSIFESVETEPKQTNQSKSCRLSWCYSTFNHTNEQKHRNDNFGATFQWCGATEAHSGVFVRLKTVDTLWVRKSPLIPKISEDYFTAKVRNMCEHMVLSFFSMLRHVSSWSSFLAASPSNESCYLRFSHNQTALCSQGRRIKCRCQQRAAC